MDDPCKDRSSSPESGITLFSSLASKIFEFMLKKCLILQKHALKVEICTNEKCKNYLFFYWKKHANAFIICPIHI